MTQSASEFAHYIKGLEFRVFLAKAGHYGFITDDAGTRVLSFRFNDGGTYGFITGNAGTRVLSQASGTGWRMGHSPGALVTAEHVRGLLYECAPHWCASGWKYYTTLRQHLAMYGSLSGYTEI